ncbi:unnamed protein product [Paramecium pentaurelia]|uniref:Uncharacterized protein n=1 Tax=Paramecium pentaurelia TaxID=43138 RepID=A0A8S1UUL7_9CILI|nr:unnamed protein product [Paramecium pentaurelia]
MNLFVLFVIYVIFNIVTIQISKSKLIIKVDYVVKILNKYSLKYQKNEDQYIDFILELLQYFNNLMIQQKLIQFQIII